MKQVFNLLSALLLTGQAVAQQAPAPEAQQRPDWSLSASMFAESGSNRLPSAISNRFILGGYIPSSRIDKTEERLTENLRAGVFALSSLNVHRKQPGSDSVRGLRGLFNQPQWILFHQQTGGIRFNDDGYRLLFQGNGDYLGQRLDAQVERARFFRYTALRAWFSVPVGRSDKGGQFNLGLAPALLHTYTAADEFRAGVFTDTLAQQVDVDWKGGLKSTRRDRSVNGWGALVSMAYSVRPSNSKIRFARFSVYDFGVFRAQDLVSRFRQAPANGTVSLTTETATLAEVFGGNWFANRRDTLLKELQVDSSRSSAWVLSPFSVQAEVRTKHLRVGLRWRNVTGYLPQLDLRPATLFGKKSIQFAPSLSLGGFDTWNINALIEWNAAARKGLSAGLQLFGLEAMAIPGRQHGAGGMVWLSWVI